MKAIMQAVEAAKKIAESMTHEEMQELVRKFESRDGLAEILETSIKHAEVLESAPENHADNEETVIRQTLADIMAEIFEDAEISSTIETEDRLRLLSAFGDKPARATALNILQNLEVSTDSLEEKIAKLAALLPTKELPKRAGAELGIAKVLTDNGWEAVEEMRFIAKDEVIRIADGGTVSHFGITLPASKIFTESDVFIAPGSVKVIQQLLDGKTFDEIEV